MANLKSSKKDIRRSEKRRIRNKSRMSTLKTIKKKIINLLTQIKIEEAKKIYNQYVSLVDKAAKVGLIHKRNAARKKSRLALVINKKEKELLNQTK